MPSRSRSLQVAGGSALLGLLGLVATSREFQHASEVASEDPEGLVAGFAAFFALSFLVTCLLALGEAGLLAVVVLRFDPPQWANRLLVAGATVGALAIPPRVVVTVWFVTDMSIPSDVLLGAWWLLAALGVFCFGLGTLLNPVERTNRNQGVLSRGVVLAPALLGFAVTVFQVLAGALFFATLVGLASLVTLWAVWLTVLQP